MTPSMDSPDTFEQRYFSGTELYGDDFDADQIAAWFRDEEHGFADLGDIRAGSNAYGYEALNRLHGFEQLPDSIRFKHALGFGSNVGDELRPVLSRCDRITLLDASSRFRVKQLDGVPVDYLMAQSSGHIALPDGSVDLITCFGVLHHIPNVSTIMAEFARVLAPGGHILVREPITTLGDWRRPRAGLTARERGIPRAVMLQMVERSGLGIVRVSDCEFRPWIILTGKIGQPVFSHRRNSLIDGWFSRLFRFNYSYHRRSAWSRFAPNSLFVVARKPAPATDR